MSFAAGYLRLAMQKANWKTTIFKRYRSTNFLWTIANSYVTNYQRVMMGLYWEYHQDRYMNGILMRI